MLALSLDLVFFITTLQISLDSLESGLLDLLANT